MKIVHTSDWHIGRTLYGRKRYEEFEAFLEWLADLLVREHVDALLVAGDVFDNSTPTNRAQGLYYRFLRRLAGSSCRHVVITAGNHDSPSFLNAPKELLRCLNVHVAGCIADSPADDVLVLRNAADEPELIVCAVPYLRDRDIRTTEAGEGSDEKEVKMQQGIQRHYQAAGEIAERHRAATVSSIPIVAMGHLFTAGGLTVDGDGVRELYVGSLAHVGMETFPECIDYLALGHLHVAQQTRSSILGRYSGSPLALGFSEAAQEKCVLLVEFTGRRPAVSEIAVPCFQALERIRGDWPTIAGRLAALKACGSKAWVEIVYEGDEIAGDLRERLDETTAETGIEILRVRNDRVLELALSGESGGETLEDLDINEVFGRCLDAYNVTDEQRGPLLSAYAETVAALDADDTNAE